MAQIHFQEKNYQEGAESLEVGLSYNFKIREHPIYHMITAMVHKENANITECINSLKSALSTTTNNYKKHPETFLSINSKVVLYLELIDAYQENNQLNEALKLIESAAEEFKGSFFKLCDMII